MPEAFTRWLGGGNTKETPRETERKVEGFKANGAVVVRDSRGTEKADFPYSKKGESMGTDPLAIYKPSGAKAIDPAKAMANFTGWVYAAVNAIASEASNVQLRLYKINGDDHEELDDHPLLTLLDGVNDHMTGIELKYMMFSHLELTGNFYMYLDGVKNDRDRPKALHLLNPGNVRVKLNKQSYPFTIDRYEYTLDGKIITFQPHQIVHGKYPDPNDPFVGIGFVQTIPTWIDTDNYAMEYNRKYFLNGGSFGMYVATQTNVEGQMERIKIGLRNEYAGVEQAHKIPVMPKGVDIKSAGMTQKDMDFANLSEVTRDRILAAARVSKTILGTAESDTNRACYDDQTEVLTENGWKRYSEVKDGEKIAEYDGERNVIRFAVPLGKYVYPYKGKMLHFEGVKMDIMVTPDHRMWYRPDHKGAKYRITTAEKLPKLCYFKAAAPQNDGEEIDLFTLPYYPKGSHPEIIGRTFYMDDWLEFLGYVISEGGISSQAKNWVITLYQKKQPHLNKIRACLERLRATGCINFGEYQTPGEDGNRFNVHGKPVVMWMHEFVGSYCKDKKIPEFIFKLCRRQRQIIFNALMVGDGSVDPREDRFNGYYSTTSHQLADDVQRLALSLGYEARVGIHYEASGNRNTCYRVSLEFGAAEQQLDWQHRGMKQEVDYDGIVWCFQTTTGLFVTRRNGKIALQGNTAETADYVFSKRTMKPKLLLVLAYLNEFLVPRYGDDLYLTFIDPVAEDKDARVREFTAASGGVPIMTQNEIRQNYLGQGPIPGGDKLLIPTSMVAAGQSETPEGEELAPQLAKGKKQGFAKVKTLSGDLASPMRIRSGGKSAFKATNIFRSELMQAVKEALKESGLKIKSIGDLTKEEYREYWKRFDANAEKAEAELKDVFKSINGRQKSEVLANLSKTTGQKAVDDPFDPSQWIRLTIDLTTPILQSLTREEAAAAFSMIGTASTDILQNPGIQASLDTMVAKMAGSYNETVLVQIKTALSEEMAKPEGTSLANLETAVKDVYDFADEVSAARIARTESARAANFANREAWKQSGVVETIKWYTVEDDKVCPQCEGLDGKEVSLASDEPFFTDETGYSDGTIPPAHPNCRCYIRPGKLASL